MATTDAPTPFLKTALELGPTLVFVLAYVQGQRIIEALDLAAPIDEPIFLATAVLMVAIAISLTVSWVVMRELPVMPMVTGVVVFVFGGLTLYLQDAWFAYVKPTIVNCLFGATLLGGLAFGRNFLKMVLGSSLELDAEGWRKLTLRYGLFFFALAVINEIVWRNFSEGFWAGFKLYGFVPITLAFMLSQMPLIMRHSPQAAGKDAGED